MSGRHLWEEELIKEAETSLLDFFVSAFNIIIHRRGNYPDGAFFFTKNMGIEVPICINPQIAEYIEMCARKLMSLLGAGHLVGVELHIVDGKITLDRFIFTMSGDFLFRNLFTDSQNKTNGTLKLAEWTSTLRNGLRRLNEVKPSNRDPSKMDLNNNRFQIKFGISEACLSSYDGKNFGPFKNSDSDIYTFPWAKPSRHPDLKSQEVKKQSAPSGSNSSSPNTLETDSQNKTKRKEGSVGRAGFSLKGVDSKDLDRNTLDSMTLANLPGLCPVDTLQLSEVLLINIYELNYGRPRMTVADYNTKRRGDETFTKRNLTSPKMQSRSSVGKEGRKVTSNPNRSGSITSPTFMNKSFSPYRRPQLSPLKSIVEGLEGGKQSSSKTIQNPGQSGQDSPKSSTSKSSTTSKPPMGPRRL